jgi:hypothetical protein
MRTPPLYARAAGLHTANCRIFFNYGKSSQYEKEKPLPGAAASKWAPERWLGRCARRE